MHGAVVRKPPGKEPALRLGADGARYGDLSADGAGDGTVKMTFTIEVDVGAEIKGAFGAGEDAARWSVGVC